MKNFKIHFLNTIWSDAIILESNGKYGFVDTASAFYYPMIKEYLDSHNIKNIEFIILTHFHSDHYGNVCNIINEYKVETLYIKKYSGHEGITGAGYDSNEEYLAHEKEKYLEILNSSEKVKSIVFLDNLISPYILNFNGVDLELYNTTNHLVNLYNDESREYFHQNKFSENANSVPIFISVNGHTVFLGSDLIDSDSSVPEFNNLTRRVIKEIYDKHNIYHVDVYKSCHHGGGGTNSYKLIELLNPKHIVITNTNKWLDKWPTIQNIALVNPNSFIYKTDFQQFIFDLSQEEIEVTAIPNESLFLTLNKS